jgi:hypothetical protein
MARAMLWRAGAVVGTVGDQVRACVSDGNERAERLYARHGFARTGERQPIRPADPTRLELAMSPALTTRS